MLPEIPDCAADAVGIDKNIDCPKNKIKINDPLNSFLNEAVEIFFGLT